MKPHADRLSPPRRRSLVMWLLHRRWRITRAATLGGQVCVVDSNGHVLLVRHGYRPGWHFPGGGVEFGENIVDAALRELQEETGMIATVPPRLHGIFNNGATFPGDHVAVFVLHGHTQARKPEAGFEIAEQAFFAPAALPAGTSGGTRRRIAEIFDGAEIDVAW